MGADPLPTNIPVYTLYHVKDCWSFLIPKSLLERNETLVEAKPTCGVNSLSLRDWQWNSWLLDKLVIILASLQEMILICTTVFLPGVVCLISTSFTQFWRKCQDKPIYDRICWSELQPKHFFFPFFFHLREPAKLQSTCFGWQLAGWAPAMLPHSLHHAAGLFW